MIDEVAEVKQYLDGKWLDNKRSYYRACYMVTRYYKGQGLDEEHIFLEVARWVRENGLKLEFSLAGCVASALSNPHELRSGTRVKISQEDADHIKFFSSNKQDRRVALALLCCAKVYANKDGEFGASSCTLAAWLGMDSANIRSRHIKRLEKLGYLKRIGRMDTMRGWAKNYWRTSSRFKILVPYSQDGQWELVDNDIQKLYEQVFDEPY